MKCFVVFLAVFALFSTGSFASKASKAPKEVLQWGELSDRSRLIHTAEIRWMGSGGSQWPKNQIKRPFQFPRFHGDEARMPFIGAVIVTHSFGIPTGDVELVWGGPNHRYVGLEFTSAPNAGISSTVQIFSR